MKDSFFTWVAIIMIFFVIIFRSYYYVKMDNVIKDRDNNTKTNIEKILYEEVANNIDLIIQEGSSFDASIIDNENHLSREAILQNLLSFKNSIHHVKNIYVILANGQYFTTSNSREIINQTQEEWYLKTLRRKSANLTAKDNNDGTVSCIVSFPIEKNNVYLGSIGYEINEDEIKRLIEQNLENFKQVYLLDEDENIVFKYYNKYNERKNDVVHKITDHTRININGNSGLVYSFEIVYKARNSTIVIDIYKIVFSLIMVMILVLGNYKLLRTKNKQLIIRISFEIIMILGIESVLLINYMIGGYNNFVSMHVPVINMYKENKIENEDLITSNIYQVFKSNLNDEMLSSNIFAYDSIKTLAIKEKKLMPDIINFFYIDKKGLYYSYPRVDEEKIIQENFDAYREVYNNGSLNEFRTINSRDNKSMTYSHLFKFKEDDEAKGVFGINIRLSNLSDEIVGLIINGSEKDIYIVLDNGNIYSPYYDEIFVNVNNNHYRDKLFYKFTDAKTKKILNEMSGWVREIEGIDAERYLFFRDYDNKTIDFVFINIELIELTDGAIYVYITVFLMMLVMYIFLLRIFSLKRGSLYIDLEKEISDSINKKDNKKIDLVLAQRLKIFKKNENAETKKADITLIKDIDAKEENVETEDNTK